MSDICACGTSSPSFDGVLHSLRELQSSPRVTLSNLGASRQGRPIPLLIVHDPAVPLAETVRLFIVARQHGTEASGTVACLALARHFAQAQGEEEQALLRQFSLLMVPVANPDGMCAGRRANAGGADLNRHWGGSGEPEISAIKAAVRKHQPHALIDMHELPAGSGKPSFRDNFIQTIGRDGTLSADLTTDCAATSARLASWMSQCGLPLSVYYDGANESLNLCHRYFGLGAGIPSYLFEAKCGSGRPLARRVRFHVLGTLVVANYALHRYYQPEGQATPQPEEPVAQAPEPTTTVPTTVTLSSPRPEQVARGQLPVVADVTGLPPGGTIGFSVDGKLRSLTTAAPHEYLLDTLGYADGRHEVTVEVCDAAGRNLGASRSVIIVDNRVAAGE
ncbi:succinylglutamate desuccinylase/aspartoacylase family protein [bacterium]|nr:succinylglutamate desuccinylase/aspartoacylase family protein [bacterium]